MGKAEKDSDNMATNMSLTVTSMSPTFSSIEALVPNKYLMKISSNLMT